MSNFNKFGSPLLISQLVEVYGDDCQKNEVDLKDYPDVDKFIEEKSDCQQKSENVRFIFK